MVFHSYVSLPEGNGLFDVCSLGNGVAPMKEPKSQADLDFGDFLFQPLLKHAESKIIKRVGCFAAYCPPVAFLVQERLRAAESEYGFILGWEDLICRC